LEKITTRKECSLSFIEVLRKERVTTRYLNKDFHCVPADVQRFDQMCILEKHTLEHEIRPTE